MSIFYKSLQTGSVFLALRNLDQLRLLSFVRDADVFTGFLLVVFFNWLLTAAFCYFSFHRSPVGR